MFTVRVLRQIFRVVPGAEPGAGTAELNSLKYVVSTDDASRLVVVSPKTTEAPASPGLPFQICRVPAVNGDGVAGEPVRYP